MRADQNRFVFVSTDEGNDSSKPAQSGNRRFKLFWINKGQQKFNGVEREIQNNLGYTILTELFKVSNNLSRINKI